MVSRTSVIIPVRNGAKFILHAIRSALVQLGSKDEIIVVDDQSSDRTQSIVGEIGDRRIRLIEGTGRGVSSARNLGLALAAGEYIAFLDHDDLWPAGRHFGLMNALAKDATIDCAVGRLWLLLEADAVILPQLADMDGRLAANLSLCTALFRRNVLDRVGLFDEAMQFCEDTDYFLRLKEINYRVVLCDIDALVYRRHASNATCDVSAAENGVMQLLKQRRARLSMLPSG